LKEKTVRNDVQPYIKDLQNHISSAIETIDGHGQFVHDDWTHRSGGGGQARVMQDGGVFEKGGVNFSAVTGVMPQKLAARMGLEGAPTFFATGVSVVLHPRNPFVPTTHCNFRYFECHDANGQAVDAWFGGGADLTPYYPYLEDAEHFHRALRSACDPFGYDLYQKYKAQCDAYFFLPHRDETRGVGGIFFDNLRADSSAGLERHFAFLRSTGDAFLDAYLPIVERRRHEPYGEREKTFQEVRRGRYAEFNLVHDRGTAFGLETGGRTESILMSLPPVVRWVYNFIPELGSREADLQDFLRPRDWLGIGDPQPNP
jgi:coproporphyrinogen III oxidase